MALNLQEIVQAPHLIHFEASISCLCLRWPLIALTGHFVVQIAQPTQLSVIL